MLQEGVQRFPEFATPSNLLLLGNMLRTTGNAWRAADAYEAALLAEPVTAKLHMQLGMTLHFLDAGAGEARGGEPLATRVRRLYATAVRLSTPDDEVRVQAQMLLVTHLAAAGAHAPALARYRAVLRTPGAALAGAAHALALPLTPDALDVALRAHVPRSAAAHAPAGGARVVAAEWLRAAGALEALDARIDWLQWGGGTRCTAKRAVVFRFGDNIFGMGAQVAWLLPCRPAAPPHARGGLTQRARGRQLHLLTLVAAYALATGRALVAAERDSWWYTDAASCPGRGFECYFRPLGVCSESSLDAHGARSPPRAVGPAANAKVNGSKAAGKRVSASRVGAGAPVLGAHAESARVVVLGPESEAWLKAAGFREWVPPLAARAGLLWFRAQLARHHVRPRAEVQADADAAAAALGLPAGPPEGALACDGLAPGGRGGAGREAWVGLHARLGDKVQEEAPRVPLGAYAAAVRALAARCRVAGVVVATDSEEALEPLRAALAPLSVRAVAGEARNAGVAFSLLAQTHAVDVARYAREALRNLLLLARADALVGTFSSNFGRLAYELQLAAASERAVGGGTPALLPPASLDFPWCADP